MWKRRRLTAKRYPGDNRLIFPKSPYRRDGLAPRCRLVASWGWSRSQGLGCSPIKAVRELGLERRETVREIAVYKSGQMLENPVHPSLPTNGKNVQGADNQQERLDGQSPSGIPRDCTPDGSDPEDTVRAAWRHAEPSRNDSAGDQAGRL